MDEQLIPASYTGGIIVESLSNPSILDAMSHSLVHERIEQMPFDVEPVWHIREYQIPAIHIADTLLMLERVIKPDWYIHFFNIPAGVLYVVLSGKSFKLPLQRDDRWEPMITYGLTVGVERRWTENIPVGRV
jgi:hypothetical protein